MQRRAGGRLATCWAAAGQRLALDQAAAAVQAGAQIEDLPLWRFLLQQGFSAACVGRLQEDQRSGRLKRSVPTGQRLTEARLQRDLAPNIAALRAEGLDTASIEQLFERCPALLTTKQATFSSSLAALRQLATLLPDDPRAVQAPPGATQLGVAVWLYPTAAARLLTSSKLAMLIEGNLQLRRQLGISDAETAAMLLRSCAVLVSNLERGEAMVAHLQRLQASGTLSAEHVAKLALSSALGLTPAEFDRRRHEGGVQALKCVRSKDPAGRQRAAAKALGELLQAADSVPGPLQQEYEERGAVLVQRCAALMRAPPASLHTKWAVLRRAGLSDSEIVAAAQQQPSLLSHNWDGQAKQLMAAWLQQELGLSLAQFIKEHVGYSMASVSRLAMRAAFLQQHRPALWEVYRSRGNGPLLSLLKDNRSFFRQSGCDPAELAAFEREWLQTPAGRRYGGMARRNRRAG